MFFCFFFAPQKLPDLWCCRAAWTLVGVEVYAAGGRAGEGWEVDRDEERHLNLINPLFFYFLFFSHPLGQCQQLEEPGKSKRCELWEQPTPTGEGEKKKISKRSVCLYYSQSVCLYYILQVGAAPKRQREVCPSTALWIAKENKPCCNNCKYYAIIPFRILWAHVLLRRELLAACVRLILVTSVLARKIININKILEQNKLNS